MAITHIESVGAIYTILREVFVLMAKIDFHNKVITVKEGL